MVRALLVTVLLLFHTSLFAATSHGYLGVFGGEVKVDGMETKKAKPLIYTLGYRLSSLWAFQLEYSESEFLGGVENGSNKTPLNIDYSTKGAYLMMIHPMGGWVDLNLKYGYVEIDYNFIKPDANAAYKERFSSEGQAYGGGLTLKMSRSLVLTFDYTQLRDDASQFSAGVEVDL